MYFDIGVENKREINSGSQINLVQPNEVQDILLITYPTLMLPVSSERMSVST